MLACAAAPSLIVLLDPYRQLRWTEREELRVSLLKSTPPGTPKPQVLAFIASRGCRDSHSNLRVGGPLQIHYQGEDSRVCVVIGEYPAFPLGEKVTVWAIWVFDQAQDLLDIEVDTVVYGL
jgi:hypothetical protein